MGEKIRSKSGQKSSPTDRSNFTGSAATEEMQRMTLP